MANPFERFYNTEVRIVSIVETGAYSKTRTETELLTINADVQPFSESRLSGSLTDEEYGMRSDARFKMFCNKADEIVTGNYARFNNKLCRILDVSEWEFGLEVTLNEHIG